MSDITPLPQFECERCARHYPWDPANIGHQFRCICGAVAPYPTEPRPADDLYAVADNAPPKPAHFAPAPIPPPSKTTTLSYAAPSAATIADPQAIKDLYMPLWLLVGGIVIEIIATAFRSAEFFPALLSIGTQLIAGTILMLLGLLLAAKFRQINLGSFRTAVFKLAAISIAPSAAFDLANPMLSRLPLFGGLLGLVLTFILYFALLGALFDLDESDTWYCVWTIFLIRLLFYFAMLYIIK